MLSLPTPEWRNGRRAGLKIRFPLKECGFKSLLRHLLAAFIGGRCWRYSLEAPPSEDTNKELGDPIRLSVRINPLNSASPRTGAGENRGK